MKYKWKVSEAPTGRYRSFSKRDWPYAFYNNQDEDVAARIACEYSYYPATVKSGDHPPLTIYVADHSVKPWVWRKLNRTANTLQQAKDFVAQFLQKNPHFMPKPIVPLRRRTSG